LSALTVQWAVPGHGPATQNFTQDLQLTQDYLQYLRASMSKAVDEGLSFEEAYLRTDWSKFSNLPLFNYANRMNAFNTYLLMEQESLK
jgi:long-subunit fatty acid transport protein